MADALEEIARVGLATWVGERADLWETQPVLGVFGDALYLIEIDESNRERLLLELVDKFDAHDRRLGIEIALFGSAGGFFASPVHFLERWPKSTADLPADVFVDAHYKAAFTELDGEIVMSVRHLLRPAHAPPKRRFRFRPHVYQDAISDLARESGRLLEDLIAVAQERAPQKVEPLHEAFGPPPDFYLYRSDL